MATLQKVEQEGDGRTLRTQASDVDVPEGHYIRIGAGGYREIVNSETGRVRKRIPPVKLWIE